jgi:hypothetical protein
MRCAGFARRPFTVMIPPAIQRCTAARDTWALCARTNTSSRRGDWPAGTTVTLDAVPIAAKRWRVTDRTADGDAMARWYATRPIAARAGPRDDVIT